MVIGLGRWVVAFLQKCRYKWWPTKCLVGLDVVNLIIFISKNGGKISQNLKKNSIFKKKKMSHTHILQPSKINSFSKIYFLIFLFGETSPML
jgi:hypothetical protein